MKRILRTANISTLFIRLIVGLIFLSEGLQKLLTGLEKAFADYEQKNEVTWRK